MDTNSCLPESLQLWGGIECTYNRVRDRYFDQLAMSGHDRRKNDLERIAAIGIRRLRYPVLWETTAPQSPDVCDWRWADERLGILRALNMLPIVGLVHHGSGPRYTNLLDPQFARGLSQFAAKVAERFPWCDAYTPVNEPLTTARFSALYGHWYPHRCDPLAFAQAILIQCRAVVMAMAAIREVRSDACLVQTEDLGFSHSSPDLAYQAKFENERRWLTFDLLAGRVDRHHPMGDYFLWLGVPEYELAWFIDHPCPPSIVGLNHYVTSQRYLDSNLDAYPPCYHGGNGRQRYADVEAVRVLPDGLVEPSSLLREAWQRYQRPIAITEAHLGCTREEQLRWLWEIWNAALQARCDGVDVRAVTVWSLLGCYDWSSLVTEPRGDYEPGAFDVRNQMLRPTALAQLASQLATDPMCQSPHPVLAQPGWWRRETRRIYPASVDPGSVYPASEMTYSTPAPTATIACSVVDDAPVSSHADSVPFFQTSAWTKHEGPRPLPAAPILIAGATGTLGKAMARVCALRGLAFRLLHRHEMDITNPSDVVLALERFQPWAVINAAGYVRVDDAESDRLACYRGNVRGVRILATACQERDLPFMTFSSDLVFGGDRQSPYCESHSVAPLNYYGRAKAVAERHVQRIHSRALIIRTSAFFGPWDDYNFVTVALRTLATGKRFPAANDAIVSPTFVPDLAHACLDLLIDNESGVWHLANQGETSWAQLARDVAERAGFSRKQIHSRPARSFGWPAPRPRYSVLGSERGLLLPPLPRALDRYFAAIQPQTAGERLATSLA